MNRTCQTVLSVQRAAAMQRAVFWVEPGTMYFWMKPSRLGVVCAGPPDYGVVSTGPAISPASCQDSRPLRGAPVAVLDFETTGLEPGARHPVQVAVALCRLGEPPHRSWSSLVRPPIPIPAESTAIHGITDAMVADAPTFAQLADELLALLDGHLLGAYNLPFDHAALTDALTAIGRLDDVPPLQGLDPLVWAKELDKYERGKRLEDVAGRRGLSFDAHDARADVGVTVTLMPRLLRELGQGGHVRRPGLDRVDAFWQWQRATALAQELDYRAWRRDKGRDDPSMTWHEGLGVDPG